MIFFSFFHKVPKLDFKLPHLDISGLHGSKSYGEISYSSGPVANYGGGSPTYDYRSANLEDENSAHEARQFQPQQQPQQPPSMQFEPPHQFEIPNQAQPQQQPMNMQPPNFMNAPQLMQQGPMNTPPVPVNIT